MADAGVRRFSKNRLDAGLSEPRWSPVFESDDVERARAHVAPFISQHALEHYSRGAAPVFRHRHATCGSLGFNELTYTMHDGTAKISVPELPGIFLFELNLFGRAELRTGNDVLPFSAGQICVISANTPHYKRWASDGRQVIVKVGRGLIHDALEAMIERPITAPVRFERTPRTVDAWTASLADVVKLVCTDLDRGFENGPDGPAGGLVSGRAAHSVERLFVELLVETIPNNYSHLIGAPAAPAHRSIKRAVEFIHAEARNEIVLDDIAAAAEISRRGLHEGFRRHFGSTPMAYLRAVRLDLARAALRAGAGSVTEVAFDCGFSHLSKFAKAYRERFGEKPSETLARR